MALESANRSVFASYGDWTIEVKIHRHYGNDTDDLELFITNEEMIDDEDFGSIFRDFGYKCDMIFVNNQNEVVDAAYVDFHEVQLNKICNDRKYFSDYDYKICINISPHDH